ncbi:MAG: zinc metalloprotease HtpX [Dehalococcoidia bacterium]|nr:zinc metalloprotease HtpX [Dehalococcoidia bacterium]
MFVAVAILGLLGFAVGYGLTADPAMGLVYTLGGLVLATVATLAAYFHGDAIVLAASHARAVEAGSYPQLENVVDELSLAAGIPRPRLYLIDDSAPNAFATGRDPDHASVAVTTGLLDKLDREELQSVIAHELSHVRNLDIRFALLVGVIVGSIALIADMFLRYSFWFGGGLRSGRGREGNGGAQALLFILALVLAIVAPIAARLVQLAVSRQREYLADASGVELTRNPVGLEQALLKISGDTDVLEGANRSTQHMYIVNPIKKFEERSQGLFSTHPPIIERVNRLRALRGLSPLEARASDLD